MKLGVDVNEVVLSNVGTTGEFKIRNSAKAFKILSDGLYSNKIRAIIRELSCNAVDSHVGAGTIDIPFEVHLPSMLEPWFSVKDYGMGLDGNQVVDVYTTYFESTKTESNDFIGALGLGSKSPFSYTENFTVTATKNGTQRIYSAFINESGVPSIAEMSAELTDEPNGVEVKFSVTNRYDYQSFRNEAINVFQWFKNPPKITGDTDFECAPVVYAEKDIVPGVHKRGSNDNYGRHYSSFALMGNIAYPLDNIPDASKHFGNLSYLLECGLVIEFGIGDLDFAASREHLSYIPLTINSIKRKLEELNKNLATHIASKANVIVGEWERAFYLYQARRERLYSAAVDKYVADTKFPLYETGGNHYNHGTKVFDLTVSELTASKLKVNAFRARDGVSYTSKETMKNIKDPVTGKTEYLSCFSIPVEETVVIVLNDLPTGCLARARYHFNRAGTNQTVYCFSHESKDLDERNIEYDKLIAGLHNPPKIYKASDLEKPVRKTAVSSQGLMTLALKSDRFGHSCHTSWKWTTYHDTIDENKTYYYINLDNYRAYGKNNDTIDIMGIKQTMVACGIQDIADIEIIGVRKNRIKEIADLDNWVWFEEKMIEETAKISDTHVASLVVADMLDSYYNKVYTNKKVAKLVGDDSFYAKYFNTYGNVKRSDGSVTQLATLCGMYGKAVEVETVKKSIEDTKAALYAKYPVLKCLKHDSGELSEAEVADYIMMVDKLEKA